MASASSAFGCHASPVVPKTPSSDRDRPAFRQQQPQQQHTPPPSAATRSLGPDLVSIPHLRDAIQKLDSAMASLINQRKELQSHLEHAVRSQSPVQRLPRELLSSIFVMGVRSEEGEDSLMLSCLMLVCRCWAEVAVNTPLLWSRITVSKHDSIQKVRWRLARSKSVPVDLTISFESRPLERPHCVTEKWICFGPRCGVPVQLLKMAVNIRKLLHLYDDVLVREYSPDHAKLHRLKDGSTHLEDDTANITCDFCAGDLSPVRKMVANKLLSDMALSSAHPATPKAELADAAS